MIIWDRKGSAGGLMFERQYRVHILMDFKADADSEGEIDETYDTHESHRR